MKIEDVDKNFKTESSLNLPDLQYRDVLDEPFDLYGLYRPRELGEFRRMPDEIAQSVSPSVRFLSTHTSGGRVRFKTDSPYVAIKAEVFGAEPMTHMPQTASHGFDLYVWNGVEDVYRGTFLPPIPLQSTYEAVVRLEGAKMRDITINFPLYSGVKSLLIGVANGSILQHGRKYRPFKPVLYYGSSITQGGCVSRPGNHYPAVISRELNVDFTCLGVSGNARAEKEMVDYLAELDASVFVCDYDHNAPDKEHLADTYPYLYRHYREKNPTTPIIFLSKPNSFFECREDIDRRDVIYRAYFSAWENGDKNVYFLNGTQLFAGNRSNDCTVDGVHPNDLGFARMASGIGNLVRDCLSLSAE